MYVFNLSIVAFLSVPLAPSSTINKSASTKAAPISVAPSISRAPMFTLLAVVIVDSLESAIEPANLLEAIEPASIALVIPKALTLIASELVSIEESSTLTANVTAPELPPPLKPSPAVTPDISPVADERETQLDPS